MARSNSEACYYPNFTPKANRLAIGLTFGSVLALFLAAAGCDSSPSRVLPMPIDSDAGQKAVAQLDANHDGKLDAEELAKAPGLLAGMAATLKSNNGAITAEDINARIRQWQDSGAGRVYTRCRVFHVSRTGVKPIKKPIVGAEVKLIPESFQGSGLSIGSDTTDQRGIAKVKQASRGGDDPAVGMSPGFYRVEITKGAEIPAKYNTATTLGAEVSAETANSDKVFELEY